MELPPLFGPGQRLGRFELVQRLAVGGMAEVYLAYAAGPGGFRKVVAIKRLLPQHALDPQLLRMFLDEARLMARLSHPNVTQVTEVDDGAGVDVPYFVMEYVHGTDLRGILNAAAGRLPIEQALVIASAVAAGLHHAHEQRGTGGQPLEIVHRDVSPSNVLISFDGGVKVTDFGVAKWTEQRSFTHQGQLKGKFAHMSPEQCRGEALDRRSDVFALGTLLYEMTTGHPPFVAESEYELLTQIVSRDASPPMWAGADGEYPADLAAIVMQSLRRSRDDRTPTAQHLQLELEAFARKRKLVVTSVALAQYLESLFSARVTEWREALQSGQTLADHLQRRPAGGAHDAHGAHGTINGRDAKDRTATDTFAVVPGPPRADGPNVPAAQSEARSETRSETRPGAARAGSTQAAAHAAVGGNGPLRAPAKGTRLALARVLAVAVGAVLAVATLFLATELTSKWQRGSNTATGPEGAAEPLGPAAPPAIPTRSLSLSDQAAAPSANAGPSRPQPSPSPSPSAAAVRRGNDTGVAAHQSRRGATVVVAPAQGPVPESGADNGSVAAPQDSPAPQPPPSPPQETTKERPAAPSPTPVKVWDPDSPVPP